MDVEAAALLCNDHDQFRYATRTAIEETWKVVYNDCIIKHLSYRIGTFYLSYGAPFVYPNLCNVFCIFN